jgi:hypothetical protein
MSVYSRSVADSARVIFPFDSTYVANQGTIVTSTLPTAYGTNPTFNSVSPSGGDGSWIYSTYNSYLQNSAIDVIPQYNGDFVLEAVFKTTAIGGAIVGIGSVGSLSINSNGTLNFSVTNGYYSKSSDTTVTVNDNRWHHVVARRENSYHTIWLDGTKVSDVYGFFGSINNDAGFFAGGITGSMDFAAEYAYLSDTQITQHASDFVAARNTLDNFAYSAPVMTASGLAVQPAITTVRSPNYAAAPATASATFANAVQSARDNFTLLNTYLGTLSLEQWYKFDDTKNIINYGSGGPAAFYFTGNATSEDHSGIQGSGALKICGNDSDGGAYITLDDFTTMTPELTDGDFSIGFWVKAPSAVASNPAVVWNASNYNDGKFTGFIIHNSGKLEFQMYTNNMHNVQTATSICDNQWHLIVGKFNGTTMSLYVDNTLIGTQTVTQFSAPNNVAFGGNNQAANGNFFSVSNFFISSSSAITTTVMGNMITYSGGAALQAYANMETPKLSFNNAFNNLTETRGALVDLRFNEGSGSPQNYGTTTGINLAVTGDAVTYSQLSRNTKAYKITNTNAKISSVVTYPSGTFSTNNTQTLIAYAKVDSGTEPAVINILALANHFGGPYGSGLGLYMLGSGAIRARIRDDAGSNTINSSGTYADSQYHLYVATTDGSTLKLYIDGKFEGSTSTSKLVTDSGLLMIGGEGDTFGVTDESKSTYIDEVSVYNYAFSAAQVFDHFQALSLDMATTANALMVQPSLTLGTGKTINPGVGYASTLLVDPTQQDTINILPTPMTAFAEPKHPNYVATVFIQVNYAASAMTSSALFHMPQYNIGEINASDTMNASALMGNATFTTPGLIQVNPMIGSTGVFVMPGIVAIRGARVFAETLTANAMSPIPPAYFQLTDDPYYVRLYNQHATVNEERVFNGASDLPGANPLEPKKSFLKFFNDVSLDIPIGTTRYLTSTLPDYVFDRPGTTYYDTNGNIYPAPTTKTQIQASGKTTATPTPLLSKGYYDPYQRPAVRINNIEFAYPENQYITEAPYTLEFTIKTTKANQIIAKGRWNSYYYNQWHTGSIGLYNGKLYGMSTFQNIGQGEIIPHPLNSGYLKKAGLQPGYMLSDIRIDDGQWHHIIVQYGFEGDSRAQFWIDGELDKQIIDGYNAPGYDGRMGIRPFILGSSSTETDFQSDFETSVWSYDPAGFVSFGDAKLNYIAYTKSVPIRVAPMLGDMTIGQDTKAAGNRTRALMLYFWPEGANIQTSSYTAKTSYYNEGFGGPYDIPTLDGFSTNDFYRTPPEQWLEWDIFPVDVTGRYLSDVIKPEAFGGEENARLSAPSVMLSGEKYNQLQYERKVNIRGSFRDDNDDFRYINLVNDIDLSQFDVIMFKNFPDDSIEQDTFSKNAEVDRYLNLTTRTLYEGFIKSVREAVDTGISLLVTNPQLAIDLGIVDRLEPLPDQRQSQDDPFVQDYERSILPEEAPPVGGDGDYVDSHYMSKIRLVTPIAGMTDYPVGIRTDKSYWVNDGLQDFTGTDKTWSRVEYRPNGLQVNDEFEVMTQPGSHGEISTLWSAPFENVKAGTIVTAWQRQIRQGQTLVDNKFTNYASSIVVKPGDILAGTQCGGKIFVDLMHPRLKDSPDYASIDLNQTYWINIAESIGAITATQATELRNSPETLENKYASQSNPEYIKKAYWTHNDSSYLILGGEQVTLNQALNLGQVSLAGKRARNSKKGNNKVIDSALGMFTGGGQLWFNIKYSYVMDTFAFWTPTISSLGILWLSERSSIPGQVTNHTAQTAVADIIHPRVVVDKVASINAQSMLALGMITNAEGKTPTATSIATLPMTANAILSGAARIYNASPMIATAKIATNFQTVTYSVDEIIVYLNHVDPILYLREDIIK